MTILAVGTSAIEFPDSLGLSGDSTDAAWFDPSFVSRAVLSVNAAAAGGTIAVSLDTPVDDCWFKFMYRTSSTGVGNSATESNRVVFHDADNTPIATISRVSSNALRIRVRGNAGLVAHPETVAASNVALATPGEIAFRLQVTPTANTFTMYLDGGMLMTHTVAVSSRTPGTARIEARGIHSTNANVTVGFSEIMVSDGVDLRGLRLLQGSLDPDAGAYDAFANGRGRLLDFDVTTAAISDAPGQRVSAAVGFTVPGAPVIHALAVNARADFETGTPDQLAGFLRIGSDTHDAPGRTMTMAAAPTFLWTGNPHTSAPWEVGDLTGLEVGLLSASS